MHKGTIRKYETDVKAGYRQALRLKAHGIAMTLQRKEAEAVKLAREIEELRTASRETIAELNRLGASSRERFTV